jgi:hypothetical protein
MALPSILPFKLVEFLLKQSSSKRAKRARLLKEVSTDVAKQLLREKAGNISQGGSNKDVMSLLS